MLKLRMTGALILTCVAMAALSSYASTRPIPKIRVKIFENQGNVSVSGMDMQRRFFSNGAVRSFEGRKRIRLNCANIKMKKSKAKLIASVKSQAGLLDANGDKHRGSILIATSDQHKTCDVINLIDIESYLSSLLSREMNATWHIEALKAQAVAARTYAIYKMRARQFAWRMGNKRHYDIISSEKHQVGGTFFDATEKTRKAAMGTKGQILLTKSGNLTETFFHARCGGRTLTPDQVWGGKVEGYQSVDCPWSNKNKRARWKRSINKKHFAKFLTWAAKKNFIKTNNSVIGRDDFRIAPDRLKNHKVRVYIEDRVFVVEKTLFRKFFGRKLIQSNYFEIESDGKIIINGRGHGHGVGMCQVGALYLARMGWDYKQILSYFYPGHELKVVY